MNRYKMFLLAVAAAMFLAFSSSVTAFSSNVIIYPVPDKSLLSADYTVQVEGKDVPVYDLKVSPEDAAQRTSAMDDKMNTGQYFVKAAFTYFDTDGGVNVSVTYAQPITTARLLPVPANAQLRVQGQTVRFFLRSPGNLTLEVNNQQVRTLHIFANPIDTDAPSPRAANVFYIAPGAHQGSALNVPSGKTILYFAPGMHTIDSLVVHDGQTLYIAGGAVVQAILSSTEPFTKIKPSRGTEDINLYKNPAITLSGSNIKLGGHGILDGSQARGKYLLKILGQDISAEGIILQDAGTWTIQARYSDRVTLSNLKLLGYRANTDGVDIVSSRDVTVQGCFIRTLDDVISLKTISQQPDTVTETDEIRNVVVKGNVFWGEVAHVLTIGTQVEAYVNRVTFQDNDIIHYLGRDPPLTIDLSGSATVGNVRFENIRVDTTGNPFDKNGQSPLIDLYIIKNTAWQRAADLSRPLGKIRGVLFSNIQVTTSKTSPKVRIRVLGSDDASNIQDVKFENITVNGRPLSKSNTVVVERFADHITGLP